MRVLVTGHRGYIGSVLIGVLRRARFEVVGLDRNKNAAGNFGRIRETVPHFDMDLSRIDIADVAPFDTVIHLAASTSALDDGRNGRSGPTSDLEDTVRLAECCKRACVSRLLFASTCAVYERNRWASGREDDLVDPLSPAAASKREAERALLAMQDRSFHPVIVRQADVYGVSPRLRLDLPLNGMVAEAVTTRRVRVPRSAARRPVIHVHDLARVYVTLLHAPEEKIAGEVFNAAAPDGNLRLIEYADLVAEYLPAVTRSIDLRARGAISYAADGSKLMERFRSFAYHWTLRTGIRQLHYAFEHAGLTPADLRSDRFRRAPARLAEERSAVFAARSGQRESGSAADMATLPATRGSGNKRSAAIAG